MRITHHKDNSYSITDINPTDYRDMWRALDHQSDDDAVSCRHHPDLSVRKFIRRRFMAVDAYLRKNFPPLDEEDRKRGLYDRWDVQRGKSRTIPDGIITIGNYDRDSDPASLGPNDIITKGVRL